MYKTILVRSLVDEGEKLIQRLASHRLHIAAAFWYYFEDHMLWRLVIVFSSLVEREGPLRVYNRIQEALTQMGAKELSLSDISVMRLKGHEFQEIRSVMERSGRVAGRHPMSAPRDIVFEDAYIYRPWPGLSSKPYRT